MSDMRAVGVIFSAVTMVAVLAAFAFTPITTGIQTQSNPMGFAGHVTLAIYDESGYIKSYIQTDNEVTSTFKDCVLEDYWIGLASPCGKMDTIHLGFNGTSELDEHTGLQTWFNSTETTVAIITTVSTGISGTNPSTFKVIGPTITVTSAMIAIGLAADNGGTVLCSDLVAADGVKESCELAEVGLSDGLPNGPGSDFFGRSVLSTQPFIKTGDTVQANYTGTIG